MCCTAALSANDDGRVEFGFVQLGKRVKYFSLTMARLGRSIRITLHLVICILHSKYADLRSISLNFEFPLSRLKFSFARRVKTLMETLITFSYLFRLSRQILFSHHSPLFPLQHKTGPNRCRCLNHQCWSENWKHHYLSRFATSASSSCPSLQRIHLSTEISTQ